MVDVDVDSELSNEKEQVCTWVGVCVCVCVRESSENQGIVESKCSNKKRKRFGKSPPKLKFAKKI